MPRNIREVTRRLIPAPNSPKISLRGNLCPIDGLRSACSAPAAPRSRCSGRSAPATGAYGLVAATLESAGPNSYTGLLVSTLQGSTETTFDVLAVTFGAVQVRRVRHALAAAPA